MTSNDAPPGSRLPWEQLRNLSNSTHPLLVAPPSNDLLVEAGISDAAVRRDITARFEVYSRLQQDSLALGSTPWWYPALVGVTTGLRGGFSSVMVTKMADIEDGLPLLVNHSMAALNSSSVSVPTGITGGMDLDPVTSFAGVAGDLQPDAVGGAEPSEAVFVSEAPSENPVATQPSSHRCSGVRQLQTNLQKHADEIRKMFDPRHVELIPLVESALAVMRLSCEKFFVLVAVLVGYLMFRVPPRAARAAIKAVSRLSTIFQKVLNGMGTWMLMAGGRGSSCSILYFTLLCLLSYCQHPPLCFRPSSTPFQPSAGSMGPVSSSVRLCLLSSGVDLPCTSIRQYGTTRALSGLSL